jgi:transcriptional regulator
MARAPRPRNAKTKTSAGSDLSEKARNSKKKRFNLEQLLLTALMVTSIAYPTAGAESSDAFHETGASPERPLPRRPSPKELEELAAELVDKRLGKLKGSKGKKMLKRNNGKRNDERVAVTAVVKLFFARLEPESARTVYEMTNSLGKEFDTIKDHLRLTNAAASRVEDAYTAKKLGVYYYEAPFHNPSHSLPEILKFYENYKSESEYVSNTTGYGPKFLRKCRLQWKGKRPARVRYVGKTANKREPVIKRGIAHFFDEITKSGARFFHPVAILVPGLYAGRVAGSRDARDVTAALLLDDHDVRELAKTLGMTPEHACVFAETVMMALLRTRCCDEDGGCGTNINDGFGRTDTFEHPAQQSSDLLIDRIVNVLTSNTGGITYEKIANELKASYGSVKTLMTREAYRSKFKSETRSGHGKMLFFRLLKTGEAPAPNLLIDRIVTVLTCNTGGITYEEIANKVEANFDSVRMLMKSKAYRSKFESETRSGHGKMLFFRLLKTGEALVAP